MKTSERKQRMKSLRNKLQLTFMLSTIIAIILTALFSLIYFHKVITDEANGNMRSNKLVSGLVLETKTDEVRFFTQGLVNSRTLLTLVDNDIQNKLSEFLIETVEREQMYHIMVFDNDKQIMSETGLSRSPLITERSTLDIVNYTLLSKGLAGEQVDTIERVINRSGGDLICITVVRLLKRDDAVIGAIIVRYLLNDTYDVVKSVRDLVGVKCAVFDKTNVISATHAMTLDTEVYARLIADQPDYEEARLWFGGSFTQYLVLRNWNSEPVAVMKLEVSADKYMRAFVSAVITIVVIMAALIAIAVILGLLISRGIVVPLNTLLSGVNRITDGDLSYEIAINLRDEIGKLGKAFDGMRMTLREKISTIQTMNEGLERTVKDRTEMIESMLNKMKKYLSPQLYESIIGGKRDGKLSHERKRLTVFFSDIKDFTSTTDSMEAENLSGLLNNYLDEMAKIALKYGGTIDKFVGDAIMVFFGDPEFIDDKTHAIRAVKMALEMQNRLNELREEWSRQGVSKVLHVRMGINTGYCTVGNFGSENRMDYTIIGTQVNLAQRLEANAPPDGIMISYETHALVEDETVCRYNGEITVKGINRPIKNYILLGWRGEDKTYKRYLRKTEEGLVVKNLMIRPDELDEYQKHEIVKALSIAQAFAMGKIKGHGTIDEKNSPEAL